jgi:hypothetical protein
VKSKAIYLAACVLLAATLACNISTPQGPSDSAPEVVAVIVTATIEPQLVEVTTESAPSDQISSPEGSSESSAGPEPVEESTIVTESGDIVSSVSVKNGDASFDGNVVYPGNDSSDDISVKPIGFDSTKTAGKLIFNLTCSGQGKAKVNYKGGIVESGSPGCGETWTISVINGSPDSHITIRLDASGDVNWSLSVKAAE